MKFHHIGVVTNDISKSIKDFEKIDGIIMSSVVNDELLNVSVCFVKFGDLLFELVAPYGGDSPVVNLLKNNITYYHICYEVNNIEKTVEEFKNKGAIIIQPFKQAKIFNENKIVFIYLKPIGVVEFVERTK